MEYKKLNKNALRCMYLSTGTGCIIAIVCVSIAAFFILKSNYNFFVLLAAIVAEVILLISMLLSPYFRFNRYRYAINDECIDIKEGYLFVKRDIVPIGRLHKLEILRGPIDRFCHVAKVKVTTAGGDVTIRFLDESIADQIVSNLNLRINEIAREE